MTDIVRRMREYTSDDHERGCQGRCYDCSCGYDAKRDPLLNEAANTIEQLRAALEGAADEIERLRAALEEIVGMEVYGFAITGPFGGDVACEGTTRFSRESDVVALRKIARAALAQGGDK